MDLLTKEGNMGNVDYLDFVLKKDNRVRLHAWNQEPTECYKTPHSDLNYQRHRLCKIWWQSGLGFIITGCPESPFPI